MKQLKLIKILLYILIRYLFDWLEFYLLVQKSCLGYSVKMDKDLLKTNLDEERVAVAYWLADQL